MIIALERSTEAAVQQIPVAADENICAVSDGDGPLGILSQGKTGRPEVCCFFLDAAGICDDYARVLLEGEELKVAKRLNGTNAGT